MSNKRARLDDNGRQIREIELELELARLRRQNDEVAREEASSEPGQAAPVQPPVPLSGTSAATPAAASAATPATATPAPPTNAATTPAGPEPQARGRGRRGRGGARGRSFSLDNRGLQTVFVCVACDKIYCQHCNAYEQARSYWARQ